MEDLHEAQTQDSVDQRGSRLSGILSRIRGDMPHKEEQVADIGEHSRWLHDHDIKPSRWKGHTFGPPFPVPGPMAKMTDPNDPVRLNIKRKRGW